MKTFATLTIGISALSMFGCATKSYVAEQQEPLVSRICKLESAQGVLDSRISAVENRVGAHETRMGSLETRLTALEMRVNEQGEGLSGLSSGLQELRGTASGVGTDVRRISERMEECCRKAEAAGQQQRKMFELEQKK